jgi:putative ABC transport system substrate-binding protein
MSTSADDPEGQARLVAFQQGLQQFGWTIGRNVQIESRWPAGDSERLRRYAAELVALSPDVILATGSAAAGPLLQATRSVPVVFVIVPDPVGAGFVIVCHDRAAMPRGLSSSNTVSVENGWSCSSRLRRA